MRGAPRLVATSDVTRFRGIAVACAVAAVVAVIAAVVLWPRASSPGALSASHQHARVGCATCHTKGTDEAPPSSACAGCHGKHATARPGHAALRADGSLGCVGCHGGHRSYGTVTFFPDGRAVRRDDVGERAIAFERNATTSGGRNVTTSPIGAFRPARATTVPLLAATKCARCHDETRAVMSTCAANGVVTCFDEHAPIRASDGAIAARAAAWDAARDVARTLPPRGRSSRTSASPWIVVALAGIAALLAFTVVRARHRFAAARNPAPGSRRPQPTNRHPSPATATAAATATATATVLVRRLPVINAATCLGCNACVEACPYDVLEVRRYIAVVARPDACCGLTLCAQVCPNQSLTMRDAEALPAVPLRRGLESPDAPDIFVVGDAGGGSLIRNAVDEGARAVATIASRARPAVSDADLLDVVIVGAGPAGLAAALEARARDLRALTLEQGTIASSIQSFPRGKLVLDAAAAGAAQPRLWLAEATKEELLARWTLTIRTEQPAVLEHRRVTALERATDGTWRITSTDTRSTGAPTTHRARAVVLAVGRRGSPRRLAIDIPPAMSSHVHYALADAASFAGRRVVIVGAGDVAMETAIALSRQPGTEVVVSYRGTDLRRGRARNIAELRRRIAAGAVRVVWASEVTALVPGAATLTTPTGRTEVGCDSVFVMIGSDATPGGNDLLTRLTQALPATQTDPPHHAFDTR